MVLMKRELPPEAVLYLDILLSDSGTLGRLIRTYHSLMEGKLQVLTSIQPPTESFYAPWNTRSSTHTERHLYDICSRWLRLHPDACILGEFYGLPWHTSLPVLQFGTKETYLYLSSQAGLAFQPQDSPIAELFEKAEALFFPTPVVLTSAPPSLQARLSQNRASSAQPITLWELQFCAQNANLVLYNIDHHTNTYLLWYASPESKKQPARKLSFPFGYQPRGLTISPDQQQLYVVTYRGGKYNEGALIGIRPSDEEATILHHFESKTGAYPQAPVMCGLDGKLYGTTAWGGKEEGGVLYRIEPDGSNYEVLAEGTLDKAYRLHTKLVQEGNFLYGLSYLGGKLGYGTLFRFDLAREELHVLKEFAEPVGRYPSTSLWHSPHWLYGRTTEADTHRHGRLFGYSLRGNSFSLCETLFLGPHSFIAGQVGDSLYLAENRLLYELGLHNGHFAELKATYTLETSPERGTGLNSLLWGEEWWYGAMSYEGILAERHQGGALFRCRRDATDWQTIHYFSPRNDVGVEPQLLTCGADGTLYGITRWRPNATFRPDFLHDYGGTVFCIQPDGSGLRVLYRFECPEEYLKNISASP